MSARERTGRGALLAALACLLIASACTAVPDPPPPAPNDPRLPVAGAVEVGGAQYGIPAGAKFVSPQGNDANDGSQGRPWRTLAAAVQKSAAGTTIVLRGGTYRETVQVYRKALHLQAYPGEAVWLSGSDVVGGWVSDGGDWRRDGWTPSFQRTNAGQGPIDSAAPLAGWPEQAFLDGRPLRQVASRGEVVPGTFLVDDAANRVYVGDDPTGRRVELSAPGSGLYFNGADNSSVKGIGIRHYATPLSQVAALRAFGNRIVLENVVVEQNAAAGASVMGSDGVIRNSTFRENGQQGVNGNNADGLVVERSYFERNNSERFDPTQVGSGIKVTRSRNLRFTANHLISNFGKGIWCDQSSYNITITSNFARANTRHGIHVELSARIVIADNAVVDNGDRGVAVMESNDVEVWNNTLLRNGRNLDVIEGPRTSLNLSSDDHDRRYPVPDSKILWQVQRVTFSNNVIAGKPGAGNPLFRVDDAGHLNSADRMQVRLNHNAYHRPDTSSPEWLALWARYPGNVLIARRLSEFQSGARQDLNGVARDGGLNPWVRSEAALDYRVPEGAPGAMGAPLPTSVANALDRPAGAAVPIGALSLLSAPRV